MTNPIEAGINHRQAGNCSVNNHHVELDLFLATLSSGPVGFGDGMNDTNRTLLMQCCTEDGRILRADTASTPIDATWAQSGRRIPSSRSDPIAAGAVWSASTTRNGSVWHFVTAIDVPRSFVLQPWDLWPPLAAVNIGTRIVDGNVLYRMWHSPRCLDRANASDCGVVIGGLPDVVTGIPAGRCQNKTQDKATCTPAGAHNWELTTVSPMSHGGIALLGELNKVVPVSSERFRAVVTLPDGGLQVTVRGAVGEKVELTFVFAIGAHPSGTPCTHTGKRDPSCAATIKVWEMAMQPDGENTVTITPDGTDVLVSES